MLPVVSALSTIAVLPSPWLCVTAASPALFADCLMISPRMYDSVKRFEPTLSVGAAVAVAPNPQATTTATTIRNGVGKTLIGDLGDRLRETRMNGSSENRAKLNGANHELAMAPIGPYLGAVLLCYAGPASANGLVRDKWYPKAGNARSLAAIQCVNDRPNIDAQSNHSLGTRAETRLRSRRRGARWPYCAPRSG